MESKLIFNDFILSQIEIVNSPILLAISRIAVFSFSKFLKQSSESSDSISAAIFKGVGTSDSDNLPNLFIALIARSSGSIDSSCARVLIF